MNLLLSYASRLMVLPPPALHEISAAADAGVEEEEEQEISLSVNLTVDDHGVEVSMTLPTQEATAKSTNQHT